ncbi:MAG: flavin reductase [Oscillospiraceae bacterium]|nr:flavin reductase [Oscillospiraceae bacterium]
MAFKELDIKEFSLKPFYAFDEGWALVSAGEAESFNTMTVSWGGLGTLWSESVATVYIRPQRYTREFFERESRFSISLFEGGFHKELAYLGSHSGRDEDKLAKTPAITPAFEYGVPLFPVATYNLVCEKLYTGDLHGENFNDLALRDKVYPESDYHRVFIGRVIRLLESE